MLAFILTTDACADAGWVNSGSCFRCEKGVADQIGMCGLRSPGHGCAGITSSFFYFLIVRHRIFKVIFSLHDTMQLRLRVCRYTGAANQLLVIR